MLSGILLAIREELDLVEDLVSSQLNLKVGNAGSYVHLELSYPDRVIRPALVILSSRIYGYNPEKAVALASAFQFIYMASRVHQGVSEKDSDYIKGDSDPRDGSQFPVLIGDYLYGKFFCFIYNAGLTNFLSEIAETICHIHEGSIMKRRVNTQKVSILRGIVQKQTARLFSSCCHLGACLSGAPKKDRELMKRFGLNCGMAYGLMQIGVPAEKNTVYLEAALNSLAMIPNQPEKDILLNLVQYLSGSALSLRRMVI